MCIHCIFSCMYLKQNVYTCMFNIVFLFLHKGGRHIERNSPNHYAPSSRGILKQSRKQMATGSNHSETSYFTLNSSHFSPHTLHCTLHTSHFHTPHSTLHSFHITLRTLHFTLHSPHCPLCPSHFIFFWVQMSCDSKPRSTSCSDGTHAQYAAPMRNTLHPCEIRCTSAWHSKLAGTSNNLAVGSTDFFVTQISLVGLNPIKIILLDGA